MRARGEGEKALTVWLKAVDEAVDKLTASLPGVAQGSVPPDEVQALAAGLLELLSSGQEMGDARRSAKADCGNSDAGAGRQRSGARAIPAIVARPGRCRRSRREAHDRAVARVSGSIRGRIAHRSGVSIRGLAQCQRTGAATRARYAPRARAPTERRTGGAARERRRARCGGCRSGPGRGARCRPGAPAGGHRAGAQARPGECRAQAAHRVFAPRAPAPASLAALGRGAAPRRARGRSAGARPVPRRGKSRSRSTPRP